MGVNVLGAKKTKLISKAVGFEVDKAICFSHHKWWIWDFRTPDDRHGWYDSHAGVWGWYPEKEVTHWTSCKKLRDEV